MSADRFADADQHERFRAALRLLDVDLKERFAGESWTLPVRRNVEGYVARHPARAVGRDGRPAPRRERRLESARGAGGAAA
jgi:hypothetical protein